ncbi:MAG: DUF2202 domain-containing protein [Campylobacterota bacterium]|nr:DUF2202 domain-containing protein [Campylobacterota bacterium]
MKKRIFKSALALSALVLLVACGSSDDKENSNSAANSTELPDTVQVAIESSTSTLSQELANTLSYMGNEERLAYDVYNRLYREWGTKQFTNIANKSEIKHIQAVQQLVQKYKMSDDVSFTNIDLEPLGYMNTPVENMQAGTYDIAKIQRLYDDLIAAGVASEIEALKVGCIIEVVDVTDLDEYITLAEQSNAKDVVDVFNYLRDGSYNHYWAFDQGLKNKGVSKGCCTWAEYCHPEYPKNEKDDKSKGKGKK